MADTRGVFRLDRVRTRSVKGTWVTPEQGFASNITTPPNIGYYGGGGISPGRTSAINKIDFTTETRSTIPSALNQTMSAVGGVGSINNGYFVGGYIGSDSSITEKFSYASETSGRAPGLNTSTVRYYVAAAGNKDFAYCNAGAPGYQTRVDKLIYAADVMADSPASYLPTNVSNLGAVASGTNAYFGGGATSASASTNAVSKTPFATDTNAAIPGTLGLARSACKGTGNEDQGYWFGGTQSGSDKSNTDKITYSSDTVGAAPGANLTTVRYNTGAAGNQSTGYNLGGSPGYTSYCDKTVYSTDTTTAVPGARLSVPTGAMGTFSPRENGLTPAGGYVASTENVKGEQSFNNAYYAGGYGDLSNISRLDFSTDCMSRISSKLAEGRAAMQGASTKTAMYAFQGQRTSTHRITYATDTSLRIPSANFNNAQYDSAACTADNAAYVTGGLPGPTTTTEKLSFSGETVSLAPGANNTQARYHLGSVSNLNHGYFVGGITPSSTSTIDRIDYASETTSRLGSLPDTRAYIAGMTGPKAGYFTGGSAESSLPKSYTARLEWSTDTSSMAAGLTAPTSTYNIDQAGDSKSHGYAVGGWQYVSTAFKLNYAAEYYSPVPGANIDYTGAGTPGGTNNAAFTGSSENNRVSPRLQTLTPTTLFPNAPNTGYWVGGEAPRVSNVDKIEYASETVSRSPYGLPELRNGFDGTGNTEKAFYLGGFHPGGPGATSNVQKLVYATDVWSAAPNLNERRYFAAVTGDLDVGYTSGGAVPASSSRTEKITFSTEATALVPGANLSATRYSMGGVSNQTSGYALGGAESASYFSRVDKMTFSNETFAYTPGANLSVAKGLVASTGNASVALLIGGATASKVSDADKLTFSTDTTSAVPSANLPIATGNCSGSLTGNGLNGYFAGGNDGSGTSAIYKTSFFTETTQYTPSRLSFARWNLASSSALESNQVTGVAPVL